MSVTGTVTLSRSIAPFFADISGFLTLTRELGTTDETTLLELDGAPTGLVGQLMVAIYTLNDELVYGPSMQNIVESPPGTGRYLATVPQPDVGRYIVVWSDGSSTSASVALVVVDDNWLRPPFRATSSGPYSIRTGDLEPSIIVTLRNSDGEPIDLTPVASVEGHIRTPTGTALARSAGILDPTAGEAMFSWEDGDTDAVGRYYDDWKMSLDDGRTFTIPGTGSHILEVTGDWGLGARWPGVPDA